MCLRRCSSDIHFRSLMADSKAWLARSRGSAVRWSLLIGLLAPWTVFGQEIIAEQSEQERLEQTVEALQATGDTWHPLIAESMTSLARLLQTDDNHTEALAVLERAVHTSRVNHGLFSLQQGPAIKMQVESHLALDEWDEADSLEQYHFYIHSRSLGDSNPELIPAMLSYAEWHVEAFADRRGELPPTRLIDAYHLYSGVMSLVDAQPDPERYPRERYLHRLAYLSWLMHRTGVQSRSETLYAKTRKVDDNWAERITDGQYRQHNNPFLQGEYALGQIIAIREQRVEESAPGSSIQREMRKLHAEAVLDLADWNLLFDRRQRAESVYRQAWALLANEHEALKQDIFDRMVLIPSFENFMQPERNTPPTDASTPAMAIAFSSARSLGAQSRRSWPWVTMRFDLTRNGRVTNVEVVESSTEINENVRRNMVMALRGSLLRPALREGSPDMTRGLVYRFPYNPANIAGSVIEAETSGQTTENADNPTAGIESVLNEAQ